MKSKLFAGRKRPVGLAVAAVLALGAAQPVLAESEIEALKRELAEQRALLQSLIAEREAEKAQKAAQAAAPTAPAAASASAKTANAPAISFYGVLDGGLERITNIQNGAKRGSVTRVPSITGTIPSRVGIRAAKEFAPGFKAIATAEAGFNLDDGSLGQSGRIFGRQLFAGIDTPYGSFTVGRQYSMLLFGIGASDLLGPNIYALGSLDAYLPNARYDNSIAWRTSFSKVSLGATYSTGRDTKGGAPASGTCAGELAGDTQSCKGWSAMVKYDEARFGVAAAIDVQHGGPGATAFFFNGAAPIAFTSSSDTDRRLALGGYAKLGQGRIGLGWLGRKVDAATDVKSNAYYLQGAYPVTPRLTLDGGVHRIVNDDQNRNATLLVLRGSYKLDDGLTGYLQLGRISNSSQAQYAVSVGPGISPPAGGSQTASMVGLRYAF
jgi:predicted porin